MSIDTFRPTLTAEQTIQLAAFQSILLELGFREPDDYEVRFYHWSEKSGKGAGFFFHFRRHSCAVYAELALRDRHVAIVRCDHIIGGEF